MTTDVTIAARAAIQHLLAGDPVSVQPEDIGGWWPGYKDLLAVYQTDGLKALRQAWDDLSRSAAGRQLVRLVASDAPAMAARPDWLLDEDELDQIAPPTWLVEDVIPADEITLVVGPSDSGKTFIAIDIACRVAQYHPVVYVAGEDARGIKIRKEAWDQHYHMERSGRFFVRGSAVSLIDDASVTEFIEGARIVHPRLVVIDTLSQCIAGADENSAKDMTQVLSNVRRICSDLGTAIILIHHAPKDSASTSFRGSGVIKANTYGLLSVKSDGDIITLECDRIKNTRPFPSRLFRLVQVAIDDETTSCIIRPASEVIIPPGTLTAPLRKTLECLEYAQDGMSQQTIAEELHTSPSNVRRYCQQLQSLNYIDTATRGRYAINTISMAGLQALRRATTTKKDEKCFTLDDGGFVVNNALPAHCNLVAPHRHDPEKILASAESSKPRHRHLTYSSKPPNSSQNHVTAISSEAKPVVKTAQNHITAISSSHTATPGPPFKGGPGGGENGVDNNNGFDEPLPEPTTDDDLFF